MRSGRRLKIVGVLLAWLAGMVCFPAESAAAVDEAPSVAPTEVLGHSGAFTTAVSITVPAHPVAPVLDLGYSSLRGSGRLGVGWFMAGFPAVERQGATGGLPAYDSTDVYVLAGRELIECGSSLAASCQTGGTHFSKVADYQRIVGEPDGSWTVTAKDGTQTRYTATFVTGLGTLRWGIESVTDTLGNRASYSWVADGTNDVYPDAVTFGGYEVEFVWDPNRVDEVTFATGAGLGRSAWRLAAIVVRVAGGDTIRAYVLGYGGNSVATTLNQVRQYGKDADVSDWPAVTGTAAPPWEFSYSIDSSGSDFFGGVVTPETFCDVASSDKAELGTADFNGDGFQDLYCHAGEDAGEDTHHTWIATSNGDGTFTVDSGWDHGCASAKNLRTGDFDGDGLADFLCQADQAPWNSEVSLNNGDGTFSPFEDWGGSCDLDENSWSAFGVADVNGDGKTDWYCHRGYAQGVYRPLNVGVSDGTGFAVTQWDPGYCEVDLVMGPDLNGDGLGDALCLGWGVAKAKLSTGSGLGYAFPMLAYGSCAGHWGTGDFNGDGKADVWCKQEELPSLKGIYMAYSTGRGWHDFGRVVSNVCNDLAPEDRFVSGDFNGDGRTDFLCHRNSTLQKQALLHIDDGESLLAGGWRATGCDLQADNDARDMLTGDFDGDGRTDLLCTERSATKGEATFWRWGRDRDADWLLTGIVEPLGGETEIEYTPGSDWDNTHGTTLPTVSAVTVSDGRGWSKRTTYTYSGYLMDVLEGRSLGFRTLSTQAPALAGELAGPKRVTWFIQDYATPGRVESQYVLDAEGDVVQATTHEYFVSGDGQLEPFVALRTGTWTYAFDGSGNDCPDYPCAYGNASYTNIDYGLELDPVDYGNPRYVYNHGDIATSGDETTQEFAYVPNESAFIVALPAVGQSWSGIGTDGELLSQELTFYDGADTWNAEPTAGLPTQTLAWLNTTGSYVGGCPSGVCIEYDPAGNVTNVIDALGNETSATYDALGRQTSSTNALGQVQTIDSFDDGCGRMQVTDVNGQTTTTTYDALCRPVASAGPLGTGSTTNYDQLNGDPTTQYLEIRTPSADDAGDQWVRRYLDGRGGAYMTVRKGPQQGQELVSERGSRDARGNVIETIADRYVGESAQVTSTRTFDTRNRIVRVDFPDGAYAETLYGLRSERIFDENGAEKRTETSADGLTVTLTEYLDGSALTTTVVSDPVARTTTVQDSAGNRWETVHDSRGRVVAQDHPDLGLWTQTYDAMSRQETATDAEGQTETSHYDDLGRLIAKTNEDGTTTYEYDQPRPGYFNVGRLTTVSSADVSLTFDHDAVGRQAQVVRTVDGTAYTSLYGHDAGGRVRTETYPDGYVARYGYDGAGRANSIEGVIDDITYNTNSTVTAFSNGVTSTESRSGERGWLDSIYATNGQTAVQDLTYDRDATGRIAYITSPVSGETWTYHYDDLYRLTLADNIDDDGRDRTLEYDALGNLTFKSGVGTYSYPAAEPGSGPPGQPHAPLTAGGDTFSYDANGHMLSGGGRSLTWNADHLPAAINGETYVYDGFGKRTKKTDSSGDTLYLGNTLIRPDGTIVKHVGPAKQVGTEWFWTHTDHLGSVHAITDADGADVQRRGFLPHGSSIDSTSHEEPRTFLGQPQDGGGLMYLGSRYYDPVLGRFLSPDPIARAGQRLNGYSYASNDPINRADPNGLDDCFFPTWVAPFEGSPGYWTSIPCPTTGTAGGGTGGPIIVWPGAGGGDTDDGPYCVFETDCPQNPPGYDDQDVEAPVDPPSTNEPTGPQGPPTCANGRKAKEDCPKGFRFRGMKFELSHAINGINNKVVWPNKGPGPKPLLFPEKGLKGLQERLGMWTDKVPQNNGALYILAHGDFGGIYNEGEPVPVRDLAREIFQTAGYEPGMPVCLIACGVGFGSYPQELADIINAPVCATPFKAAQGTYSIYTTGREQAWYGFYPTNLGNE